MQRDYKVPYAKDDVFLFVTGSGKLVAVSCNDFIQCKWFLVHLPLKNKNKTTLMPDTAGTVLLLMLIVVAVVVLTLKLLFVFLFPLLAHFTSLALCFIPNVRSDCCYFVT